jgi:hypothetical protein
MQESKLHKWISRLDRGEQNAFVRYVEALGGKNRDELGRIAKLFVKKVVRGKGGTREEFYAAMGWPAPYNPAFLHSRLSDLKKKLEAFLAIQELRNDPVAVAAFHMRAVGKRGWSDFMKSEVKQAREVVQAAPADVDRFLHAMQIEESFLETTMELPRKFKEPSFQGPMQHLEEFFCLQKLRYTCAALNQDRLLNIQHDYGMLDVVIAHLLPRLQEAPPVLRMYFFTYQMMVAPTEAAHFNALKQELNAHWRGLSGELTREFYKYLVNHCIDRINAGFAEFHEEIVRIYDETMRSGALLMEGMMDPGQLKNMIAIMLRNGKMDLAERLLETYGPKLTPDADPVTVEYNRAIILYHRGEYSKARKLLEIVLRDAEDAFYKLDAKVYSWRASYEMGDLDMSEDNYNSLRMYLQRDKLLSKVARANYLLFANFLNSLLRISNEGGNSEKRKRKLQALQTKLQAARSINNIIWLREKVALELKRV